MSSKFIVFEGIDGAGKGDANEVVREALAEKRQALFVSSSSPRYETPTGKLVKRALTGEFGDFVGLNGISFRTSVPARFRRGAGRTRRSAQKGNRDFRPLRSSTFAYHGAKFGRKSAKRSSISSRSSCIATSNSRARLESVFRHSCRTGAEESCAAKRKTSTKRAVAYQKRVADVYRATRQAQRVASHSVRKERKDALARRDSRIGLEGGTIARWT